jgi:hypothetical protein
VSLEEGDAGVVLMGLEVLFVAHEEFLTVVNNVISIPVGTTTVTCR